MPLDEVRGWWRYHHLFADLLRARLQAEQPGRAARLHRNAAAWYEEHGLADDAIRHAAGRRGDDLGGPADRAALRRASTACAAKGRRSSGGCRRCPLTWSGPAPGCCWRRRCWPPPAAAWRRWSRCSTRPSARPPARPRSRSSPLSAGPRSMLVNIPALIALHRSYLAQLRGDAEATAAFASQALAELGEGEWMLNSVAQWNPGRGRMAPRPARGGRARLRVQHRRVAGGRPAHDDGWGCITSARSSAPRAAWTRPSGPASRRWRSPRCPAGRRWRPPARRMWAWPRWPTSGTSSTPRCGMSPRASRCAASSSTPRRWPPAWLTLAWIRQATGDPAGALEAIERGRAGRAGPGRACSTPSRRSGRGCCWPRATWPPPPAGRRTAASTRTTSPDYPREPGHLVLARVLLAQDGPARHSRCWTGCTRRRPPRTGPAASSRSARCGRWRWRPAARKPPR